MALLSQTALRSDPVLNHNFVVSLLDTQQRARDRRLGAAVRDCSTSRSGGSPNARASKPA